MLWLDWRLMLVVAGLAPVVALIVALYQRLSAPAVVRNRELRSDLNAQMAESIAGMQVLQASNATARFREHFARLNEATIAPANGAAYQRMAAASALDLLAFCCSRWSSGFGMRSRGCALGAVEWASLRLHELLSRVMEPLTQITMQFSQLQLAMVGAARVQALLKETQTPAAAARGRVTEGAIDIERLDFAYQPGHPVLHGLNLQIAPERRHQPPAAARPRCIAAAALLSAPPGASNRRHTGRRIGETRPRHRSAAGRFCWRPRRENIAMGRNLTASRSKPPRATHPDFIAGLDGATPRPWAVGAAVDGRSSWWRSRGRWRAAHPNLDEAVHIDSETEQVVQRALTDYAAA
jgi:ATP-binding cassette subfamily B protein/ATP-binding cassette subfamily C protein/ATP-binding cassette subfamily B multidrug efflux pump